MNKDDVLKAFKKELQAKWEHAKETLEKSHKSATSSEAKQEGKYDTRSIEESYLAQGLTNNLKEIEDAISSLNSFIFEDYFTLVEPGALVGMERNGEVNYFLISEKGGGHSIQQAGAEVTIISTDAPLFQSISGKFVGQTSSLNDATIQSIE